MNGPLKFLTARKICSCSLQNSNHRKCVGGGGGGGGGKEGVGKKWGREMFCFGLCPDASMRPY